MYIALAMACAAGFQGHKPEALYETAPQMRQYVEVGHVRATPWLYGVSGRLARETAMVRLVEKSAAMNADAVIAAKAIGGCPGAGFFMWMMLSPNCWPKADGIAVRWTDTAAQPTTINNIDVHIDGAPTAP